MVKKFAALVACSALVANLVMSPANADEAWAYVGTVEYDVPIGSGLELDAYFTYIDVLGDTVSGQVTDLSSKENFLIEDPQARNGQVKVFVTNNTEVEYTGTDRPRVQMSLITETELCENGAASANVSVSGSGIGHYALGGETLYAASILAVVNFQGGITANGGQHTITGSFSIFANGGARY